MSVKPSRTWPSLILLLICGLGALAFIVHPWSLAEKLFAIAYGLDPQRPSHTYFFASRQLPLEARKLGMFGGFLLTYLGLLAAGRMRAASFPPRRIVFLLVSFVAVMGLDGLNALFSDLGWPHLYTPDLRLRLATGLLTGVALAGLLLPAVNGSLWRTLVLVPSFARGTEVAGAVALCASLFLAVDARLALLYYPVAILGVAGLITVLIMINIVFVLALTRRVGCADTVWDAVPVVVCALFLAVCELAFMSGVRYLTLGDITNSM